MSFCACRGKSAAAGRQRWRTGKRPEQQRKKERFIFTSIPRQLLLHVILILLNAFFAAAESAVVSLNVTKLRRLEEEGDKKAGRRLKLVE